MTHSQRPISSTFISSPPEPPPRKNRHSDILTSLKSSSSNSNNIYLQQCPPDSPISEQNPSISSQERKQNRRKYSVRNAIAIDPKFREIPKKALTNYQQARQQQIFDTRKKIVDSISKLFKERSKIGKDIEEIKVKHDDLSKDKNIPKENTFS